MKKIFLQVVLIGLMCCVAAYGQVPATGQSSGSFGQMHVGKTTLGTLDVQSIPNKLSYQGLLTTSSGAPAQDGNYDLKFELFNVSAGGSGLWTETQTTVSVQHGTFSVLLGSVTPLTALFDQPLWVEVTAMAGPGISSPIVFSPRTELASSPYALGPLLKTTDGYYLSSPRFGLSGPPIGDFVGLDVFSPNHSVRTKMTSPAYSTGFWADKYDQSENNYFVLQTGGADRWSLGTMGNDDFSLYNWSFGRYDISATMDGLVGIGTKSPTKKLDVNGPVQVKDTLFVGSSNQNGFVNVYQNGASNPILKAYSMGNNGGALDYFDELGNWIGGFEADVAGTGGFFFVERNVNFRAFTVDGNYAGTEQPRVAITGSARSAIFDISQTADASVQLPDSSISSVEILDEPGISNSQLTSFATNNTSGTIVVADSVDITVPAPGYIEIIGGAWLNIYHTTGTTTEVWLGINTTGGSQSVYPGLGVVRLPGDLPTSATSYGYPCSARRFYTVSAGTYRYYLNLRFSGAGSSAQAGYPYVRAVYYPTLYGTSTVISPSAIGLASVSTDGSEQINIEQVTITPEEHLAQLKAKAMLLKSEMEATLKQLEKKTGDGQANGGN
jgi:hypothetical protein